MAEPLHTHHQYLGEVYEDLRDSDEEPHDRIVAISGQRAAGTSTHASDLATEFGIEHVDNGTVQREKADEHGYDDVERFRDEHPDADLEVDAAKLERAYDGESLLAEGRLDAAALSAERDDGRPIAPIRIKITCDDDTRARRYADREGLDAEELDEAREELVESDEKVYDIFAEVYDGIDPRDEDFYTHVIDNSGDYEEVHEELVSILEDAGFERRQV
jgi:cytidylate kinase